MTNLEAIRVNISGAHGVVLTENHFVKALVDVGLTAAGTYSDSTLIDRATVKCYDVILGGANISEGDLSYNINIDSVRAARQALLDDLGIEKRKDQVNRAAVW